MTNQLPYNLSLQFALAPPIEHYSISKKTPKARNKKVKEKQEYDILQIHDQIKACFVYEKTRIPEYKKRIASMSRTIVNLEIPFGVSDNITSDIENIIRRYQMDENGSPSIRPVMTYREFLDFYDQLKRLIAKTENIESDLLLNRYIELTESIICEYKKILAVPIKMSFLTKSRPKTENEEKKNILLDSYLKIASNFIDIDYVQEIPEQLKSKYTCDNCGNATDFESKDGLMTCEQCGLEVPIVSCQTSFKDIDRINMHSKYRYEKSSHFKEGIYQYQGKQNKYIDPSLYTQANEWLTIHNLLDLKATTKRERYAKVTKDHLRLFLSESEDDNLTKHYEDLHLIFSKLTGIPCPDISYLEETLYAQFDKLVEAFLNTEGIDRTNILNSNFVLKKLLLMNKYPINPQDFPGLKTVSRMLEHETLFAILCQKAGLNNPDTTNDIRTIPKTIHNGFL